MGGLLKSKWVKRLGIASCGFELFTALFLIMLVVAFFGMMSGGGTPKDAGAGTVTSCGETVGTLVDGVYMAPSEGKLGHEQHLNNGLIGSHYEGPDSNPLTFAPGTGAFHPYSTDEERWYFNTQWGGFDWTPTRYHQAPTIDRSPGAAEARKKVPDSKLIITSIETKKSIVVSAQESGPALWVTDRDGINAGAPPEVYNYLGTSSAYTKDPNDIKGQIKIAFAKDQNAKLGPCN